MRLVLGALDWLALVSAGLLFWRQILPMSRHEQTIDIGQSLDMTRSALTQTRAKPQKTRQPCRNEPNGSATALANQDHWPCGQAMTTVIQFSQPRPIFLSEKGYGSYNRVY
eukprot:scaffold56962_cov51-Attheya_sp.AAC.1